jgi:transcriptional regulator with XRE-family HTH domain
MKFVGPFAIASSQSTIAQYENGTSKLSVDILTNIAQVLGTTADYLLGLSDSPN